MATWRSLMQLADCFTHVIRGIERLVLQSLEHRAHVSICPVFLGRLEDVLFAGRVIDAFEELLNLHRVDSRLSHNGFLSAVSDAASPTTLLLK
jgi:hypothetical protein